MVPPPVTLDIGHIEGKDWALVEAKPVWSTGLYGCDPAKMLPGCAGNQPPESFSRRKTAIGSLSDDKSYGPPRIDFKSGFCNAAPAWWP